MSTHTTTRDIGMWSLAAILGVGAGIVAGTVLPPAIDASGHYRVAITALVPFALLLACIATGPILAAKLWHKKYPLVSLALGGIVAGYYFFALAGHGGRTHLLHAMTEYYSFFALVGGLYIASGGILVKTKAGFGPKSNTLFLAMGAVLANILGTTGASVLLIRPFLRANVGRLRPLHVVFFIFIVSNCGGSLTPIGDPPLYLGYLKGVPFFWTTTHLLLPWVLTNLLLLAAFYVFDSRVKGDAQNAPSHWMPQISISAPPASIILLAFMVLAVFIDPLLRQRFPDAHLEHYPISATVQVVLAGLALALARKDILRANDFTLEPAKEVGLLFAGIFCTMMPALSFFAQRGGELGLTSPTHYYFATGVLSAMLDNAPTYLNFLQIALTPSEVSREVILALLATSDGNRTLVAISAGAVFFGAMTYIGNGPNFMVKSIAEARAVAMPSFFAYLGWACAILLPALLVTWAVTIR